MDAEAAEGDVTHFSFFIDEEDESVIINEEKLKSSEFQFVRRYRNPVLSDSMNSTLPLDGCKHVTEDAPLFSSDDSACGSGFLADDCLDGLRALNLSDAENEKENRSPSFVSFAETPSALAVNVKNSADVAPDICGDILAPYFKPEKDQQPAERERPGQVACQQETATCEVRVAKQEPSEPTNSPLQQQLVVSSNNGFPGVKSLQASDDALGSAGSPSSLPCAFASTGTAAELVGKVSCEVVQLTKCPAVLDVSAEEQIDVPATAAVVTAQREVAATIGLTDVEQPKKPQAESLKENSGQNHIGPAAVTSSTEPECSSAASHGVEMACQTSFCMDGPVSNVACVTPAVRRCIRQDSVAKNKCGSAPAKPIVSKRESMLPGCTPRRVRTPSNIPVSAWNSPMTPAGPRKTMFKVPTPMRGAPLAKTPVKTPAATPVKAERSPSSKRSPHSAGKLVRSPWSVLSPVARYIHENPAPPLIQIVRPRKSPSAKSLSAATSPISVASSSTPPRVLTGPLPDKRYHSSNKGGVLTKAGLDPLAKPTKPIVIKHTLPSESGGQSTAEMDASVIQVIRR
ncbi:uncharacterized protein LOC144170301 [Haemaphysalis longicornis]